MTSLPPSLQEARNVQALNEKLQRKDDVIKAKKTQIKMLLADNERMKAGSTRAKAEVARLRAKLQMLKHNPAAAMGMPVGDSDEVLDSSLPSSRVLTPKPGVYEQMDDGQEPVSLFMASRPHSSASSRHQVFPKPPVSSSPVGKPKNEEFNAGIVGVNVRKISPRRKKTEKMGSLEKNLLPELKPTVLNESMNARQRPSDPKFGDIASLMRNPRFLYPFYQYPCPRRIP